MAHYLVKGKPVEEKSRELKAKVMGRGFSHLRPFGSALSFSLENARVDRSGSWLWEEEDYCSPPLAQERRAVLDLYFTELEVEKVSPGSGWEKIGDYPRVFPESGAGE